MRLGTCIGSALVFLGCSAKLDHAPTLGQTSTGPSSRSRDAGPASGGHPTIGGTGGAGGSPAEGGESAGGSPAEGGTGDGPADVFFFGIDDTTGCAFVFDVNAPDVKYSISMDRYAEPLAVHPAGGLVWQDSATDEHWLKALPGDCATVPQLTNFGCEPTSIYTFSISRTFMMDPVDATCLSTPSPYAPTHPGRNGYMLVGDSVTRGQYYVVRSGGQPVPLSQKLDSPIAAHAMANGIAVLDRTDGFLQVDYRTGKVVSNGAFRFQGTVQNNVCQLKDATTAVCIDETGAISLYTPTDRRLLVSSDRILGLTEPQLIATP